jgi:hypothetical protein
MKEAMKLALEDYLSCEMPEGTVIGDPKWWAGKIANVLANQEQGESVEWGVDWGKDGNSVSIIKRLADGNIEVLAWEYAPHPQQRTWVGLTDEDVLQVRDDMTLDLRSHLDFYRACEAKLKDKNT